MGTVQIVVPLVFGVPGMLAFWYGMRLRRRAQDAIEWPWVWGRIVTSSVRERISRNYDGHPSVLYEARVSYEYRVDGNDYRGSRVHVDDVDTTSRLRAEGICAEFHAGRRVRVYYDPLDPNESILRTGVGGGAWIWMTVGAVFTVGSIAFALAW